MPTRPIRVCFVCLGNICRSPTAESVFRKQIHDASLSHTIEIESAGTGGHHTGEPSDPRSRAHAKKRGYALDGRARQFVRADFSRFDLVIAMDRANHAHLLALAPDSASREKLSLLRDYDASAPRGSEVPDPYYGGPGGFDEVIDVCEAACRGLLAFLRDYSSVEPETCGSPLPR